MTNILFMISTEIFTMKSFCLLSLLSCFVFCEGFSPSLNAMDRESYSIYENDTITHWCEMECKDVCIPCQEPIRCGEEETDCGLGPPDPKFGGVCPPHSICVPKDMNCKYLSNVCSTIVKKTRKKMNNSKADLIESFDLRLFQRSLL